MKEPGGELPQPAPAALPLGPSVPLVDILLLFARIGLTSFGGGLSAWIYREVVVRRRWLTEDAFLSGMTLAQIMPGTNVVNVSIYIGHRLRGAAGSAVAVWPTLHAAVVVGHAVPVRVSPTLIEEPIFTLPEAEIVDINGEHDGFMLIKTAAGRSGWAPNANLALIVPKRP